MTYASRAGQKLEHALKTFAIDATGLTCADLGCSTGGFTDCLLHHHAKRVYAIDTGYGVLDWRLRNDPRVTVMERTNAMHAKLPEPVQLITIDVAWTRQRNILPSAKQMLGPNGQIITLIKPHYETTPDNLRGGVLPDDLLEGVLDAVTQDVTTAGFEVKNKTESPIRGGKGNREWLFLLSPS